MYSGNNIALRILVNEDNPHYRLLKILHIKYCLVHMEKLGTSRGLIVC